jgi:hypothetical protein
VSFILGRLDANGQVLLINPNGIVFGGGAQVNVGSLIATTSNMSDANFMAGRLAFDVPGRPGAATTPARSPPPRADRRARRAASTTTASSSPAGKSGTRSATPSRSISTATRWSTSR